MILKFLGDSDNSKVCTICARWAVCSFSSSGKRKEKTSPDKDYMFGTLTQLERDLVKFVSRVQNLKLATVTGDNQCDGSAASPQRMVKEQTPKGSIPSGNGNEKLIP